MSEQHDDTPHSPGRWMSFITRCGHRFIGRELADYGFGSGQFQVLLAIHGMGGANQETLAERIRIDKANVARAVAKLEELGYVRREAPPDDQRVRLVFITARGEAVLGPLNDVLTRWNDIVTAGLTPEDRAHLLHCLQVMADNAARAVE